MTRKNKEALPFIAGALAGLLLILAISNSLSLLNWITVTTGFLVGIYFGSRHKAQKELQYKDNPEEWSQVKPKASREAVGIFFFCWFAASLIGPSFAFFS